MGKKTEMGRIEKKSPLNGKSVRFDLNRSIGGTENLLSEHRIVLESPILVPIRYESALLSLDIVIMTCDGQMFFMNRGLRIATEFDR